MTFGTDGQSFVIEVEMMTVFAHPARLTCRITYHQRVGRYIFRYHRTCSDQRIGADDAPAYDGRIRSDGRSFLYTSRPEFMLAGDGATRINNVRKHAARSQKNVVFTRHAGIDRDIILHLDPIAQTYSRRDDDVLPDRAVTADRRAGHDV